MIRSTLRVLAIVAALAALPASAAIDNTAFDFGTVAAFGAPNSATYGQTFRVAPGDGKLTGFSMFLRNRIEGSGPLMLRGYVASWDGAKADHLFYTSTVRTMNTGGNLQEFAFDTDIVVQPGFLYVAFLSVSDLGLQARSKFGMPLGGDIVPGGFVFANNGLDFGALFTSNWEIFGSDDVWFKASFAAAAPPVPGSNVPEPATWALMLGGFALTGLTVRRRRIAA